MAFHRLDIGLLLEGAGAQQFAVLAFGEHLAGQVLMVVTPAAIEGL